PVPVIIVYMKIKMFIAILILAFFSSYCQAQYLSNDSMRKCLFGEWVQMHHHKGQVFFFDTTKLTVKIIHTNDSVTIYPYSIKADTLFFFGSTETWKARIVFSDCDKFYLTLEAPPNSTTSYRRKYSP